MAIQSSYGRNFVADDVHILDIASNENWARRAADVFAAAIEASVRQRGRCVIALSGGGTPVPVFELLATYDLPWQDVVLAQADERLVPIDSDDRNFAIQQGMFQHLAVEWLPFPVNDLLQAGSDAEMTAIIDGYWLKLAALIGEPPIFDLVHLGIGADGHTASLFPGQDLTEDLRNYVGITPELNGHRRISLTRPVLDRAQMVLWLVSGSDKAAMLGRLLAGDMSIPAGLLRPSHSVVIADMDAARQG